MNQQFFRATSRTFVGVDSSEYGDENDVIECKVLSGVVGMSSLLNCIDDEEDVIASSTI